MTAPLDARLDALLSLADGLARGTYAPKAPAIPVPAWPKSRGHILILRPVLRELFGLGAAICMALLATQSLNVGFFVVGAPSRPSLSATTLPMFNAGNPSAAPDPKAADFPRAGH